MSNTQTEPAGAGTQAQLHREGWVGKIFLSCQQLSSRAKTCTRAPWSQADSDKQMHMQAFALFHFCKIKQNCKGVGVLGETRH